MDRPTDAREPQNAPEVRSVFGLPNYNARFISDFSTVAKPLRRLTKKDVRFESGDEQRKAFTAELKLLNISTKMPRLE